jgi:hypothetical protein
MFLGLKDLYIQGLLGHRLRQGRVQFKLGRMMRTSPPYKQCMDRQHEPCAPTRGAPCITLGAPAAGEDPDDEDDNDSSSSYNTDLSEEQEPEGWVARPITRDAAHGCHFHDALDTLLHRDFDRHTWSIEYRCVVYQHSHEVYPDR